MKSFKTKSEKLSGTNFKEVYKKAFRLYQVIKKESKRRPYVRSAFFQKEKIFLPLYWQHLHEKFSLKDKTRRVKYFSCAIELLKKSKISPESKPGDSKSEILHRFTGITPEGDIFFVQIKEDRNSKEKWLISTFPLKD